MNPFHSKRAEATGILRSLTAAFTLVEILVILGVASIIAGAGYVVVTGARESASNAKLENDVAAINRAVQIYRANGGSLPPSPSPQDVLDKLKTEATASSAQVVPGLTGRMVDTRLTAVMQSPAEAATSQPRARWNTVTGRFEISTSGAAGVQRFDMDDETGVNTSTETRTATLQTDKEAPWVWDYADKSVIPLSGPTNATNVVVQTLAPPTFSPASGPQPLPSFNVPPNCTLAVSIGNPNPANVSRVLFTTGGSVPQPYTGAPVLVPPGGSISAYVESISPAYVNSSVATATYPVTPFTPQASITPALGSLTYAQAGGAMFSGAGVALPVQSPQPATISVANLASIPSCYTNTNNFQLRWTTDGSNPLTSTNATVGNAADVGIARWGTNSILTIRAAVRSLNTNYFTDSPVASTAIGILVSPLPPPSFASPAGSYPGNFYMGIGLDAAAAYPAGLNPIAGSGRLHYRLGLDPGDNNGNPVFLNPYVSTVPIFSIQAPIVDVIARIYPPLTLRQWFSSSAATVHYEMDATPGFQFPGAALVNNAKLLGPYTGSIVINSATDPTINFNNPASVSKGNIYAIGTPNIVMNGGSVEGREFLPDGTEIIPAQDQRTVVDLTGSATPNNYTIRINPGFTLEGKIYRRIVPITMPTVSAPAAAGNNNSITVSSATITPINPSAFANVTIRNSAGDVRLLGGNYRDLSASGAGNAFVLGTPGATTPTVYNIQNLNLGGSTRLKILGPVILNLANAPTLGNSTITGTASNPEWLTMNILSGNLQMDNGTETYARLIAPNSEIKVFGIFRGGIVADSLEMSPQSAIFTLAPPGT